MKIAYNMWLEVFVIIMLGQVDDVARRTKNVVIWNSIRCGKYEAK